MKKTFALLLSAFLLFTVISGCSGSGNEEEGAEPEAPGEKVEEEVNFYGTEFTMGSVDLHEFVYDVGVTAPGDRMLARYDEAREKLNLVLKFYQPPTTDAAGDLSTRLSAMTEIPDFYDMMSIDVYTLYKLGVLADYKTVNNLDINSERWGTSDFLKQVTFRDGIYGVWCNDWENPVPQMGCTMLVNNILYNEFLQPNMYETLEQGQWTWDNFREILTACTLTEGDKTIYGLNTHGLQTLLNTAIFSNGVSKTVYANGKYSFGYNDDRAAKAIDYVKTIRDDGSMPSTGGNGTDFGAGNATFLVCDSWVGTADAADMTWLPLFTIDDFGWMPFPYGPDAEYGSWNAMSYYNQRFFAMIPTENEPDDIATVMNFIFAPLEGTSEKAWKVYARTNMFFSDESFDIFVNELENIKCDYSSVLGTDMLSTINAALQKAYNGSSTYGEAISSIESKVNDLLDSELNN